MSLGIAAEKDVQERWEARCLSGITTRKGRKGNNDCLGRALFRKSTTLAQHFPGCPKGLKENLPTLNIGLVDGKCGAKEGILVSTDKLICSYVRHVKTYR